MRDEIKRLWKYRHLTTGYHRQSVNRWLLIANSVHLIRGREGKRPLEPITVSRVWERIQTDLIDMRHTPDGRYAWILHIKDHYSKYTQLYALKGKDSEGIAECLAMFIMAFTLLRSCNVIMERN